MRQKILRKAIAILRKVAGLLMLAIILVVTVQLVSRNILKISTPWSEDVAKLLLIWMTFLGSPVVLFNGEHLAVDLISAHLTGRKKILAELLIQSIVISFCITIIYLGFILCTNRIILKSTTAAAGLPRIWMFSALPVGGILMLLVALNQIIDNVFTFQSIRQSEK